MFERLLAYMRCLPQVLSEFNQQNIFESEDLLGLLRRLYGPSAESFALYFFPEDEDSLVLGGWDLVRGCMLSKEFERDTLEAHWELLISEPVWPDFTEIPKPLQELMSDTLRINEGSVLVSPFLFRFEQRGALVVSSAPGVIFGSLDGLMTEVMAQGMGLALCHWGLPRALQRRMSFSSADALQKFPRGQEEPSEEGLMSLDGELSEVELPSALGMHPPSLCVEEPSEEGLMTLDGELSGFELSEVSLSSVSESSVPSMSEVESGLSLPSISRRVGQSTSSESGESVEHSISSESGESAEHSTSSVDLKLPVVEGRLSGLEDRVVESILLLEEVISEVASEEEEGFRVPDEEEADDFREDIHRPAPISQMLDPNFSLIHEEKSGSFDSVTLSNDMLLRLQEMEVEESEESALLPKKKELEEDSLGFDFVVAEEELEDSDEATMAQTILHYHEPERPLPQAFKKRLASMGYVVRLAYSLHHIWRDAQRLEPSAIFFLTPTEPQVRPLLFQFLYSQPQTRHLPVLELSFGKEGIERTTMCLHRYQSVPMSASFWSGWFKKTRVLYHEEVEILSIGAEIAEEELDPLLFFCCGGQFEVESFQDPSGGIQRLYQKPPDLLVIRILDMQAPWVFLFGELKRSVRTSEIPILIFASEAPQEELLAAMGPLSVVWLQEKKPGA